ncbi:unnamed protein product [Rotaria socialis]|uniref:EamA domain-containing protein n=2 Tax=Rotaria socialis TaxID=392032 RepID=A0A817Z6C8_9BILA|nr:unnamed protein product [Rotaria socialis]
MIPNGGGFKTSMQGVIYLCVTVLLWCSWHIVGRIMVNELSSLTILAFRCVFACPVLFAVAWFADPIGMGTVPKSSLRQLFTLGLLLLGGNSYLFILGLKWTSASEAALTQPLIIIFTAIFEMIFRRENKTNRQSKTVTHLKVQKIGIVCCVVGSLWILINRNQVALPIKLQSSSSFGFHRMLGFMCLLGNTLCFSVYTCMQSRVLSNLSPPLVSAYSYGLVTPLIVIINVISCGAKGTLQWKMVTSSQWMGLLYVGVFATGLASLLYSYANKCLHPTVCGLSAALQPLVSCLLSAIFLQERLSLQQIIAATFIIGGVTMVIFNQNDDSTKCSKEELSAEDIGESFLFSKVRMHLRRILMYILIALICVAVYIGSVEHAQLKAENHSLRDRLSQLVKKQQAYRVRLGEVSCALHGVGPTGGFCRQAGRASDGGHHLDQQLCLELSRFFSGSTVYDLGAGMGQYTNCLREVGSVDSLAFDGAENIENASNGTVRFMDLSEPQPWEILGVRDWVLSLEVAEHIPASFESTYLHNIDQANRKGIVLSWAIRNQPGFHHINCRNNSEVISILTSMGYKYNPHRSEQLRYQASLWWFRQTIMIFSRVILQ